MTENILAKRYASSTINAIWCPVGRITLEREFWIAVMKAQQELGLAIPTKAILAYEQALHTVDLDAIMQRERLTKHDVKARIEEFNALAGEEHIHKGLTSRDLTENVEQLQIYRSLNIIRTKAMAALHRLAKRSQQWESVAITARTHNVAAQQTTMGKRLAMFGEELQLAIQALESLLNTYHVRGLKGAVGTQMDQISLFAGNCAKAEQLEQLVGKHLGIPEVFTNVGQVYPRSLDLQVVSVMNQLASAPSSFAKTLRLMAGHETASEGFAPGQTGSSAMPHKMNSRSCERINGFKTLLSGYLTMASTLAGDQWNEGDVSCSVVRRVMLPDTFYSIDGLLETFLTVLGQMELSLPTIEKESTYYLPFLLTTTIMMEAVKAGSGRETVHKLIKHHAIATLNDLKSGTIRENDLFNRLAQDPDLPLDTKALEKIAITGQTNIGMAKEQTNHFQKSVERLLEDFPEAYTLKPEAIL